MSEHSSVKKLSATIPNNPFVSEAVAWQFDLLTDCEREVLQLLAKGHSNKEVAMLLTLVYRRQKHIAQISCRS